MTLRIEVPRSQQQCRNHRRDVVVRGGPRSRALDWFFDEWVYGTQVRRYHFDYQLSPADGGAVKLHMSVTQSEVDSHSAMLVHVYADFGDGWCELGKFE